MGTEYIPNVTTAVTQQRGILINSTVLVPDRVRLTPDGITADDDDPAIVNLVMKENLVHSYYHAEYNKGHAFGTCSNFNDAVWTMSL